LCPKEGNLREQVFALESYKLLEVWVENKWRPKFVGLFLGKQSGYTKFLCFLCELDSRAEDKHYKIKD